ncbi:hypothetical protein OL229_04440 [Neisseriaceae bacterium JH1-16]|nr:hypothetical protein [Neisseriaceae bacterium JH1-16]
MARQDSQTGKTTFKPEGDNERRLACRYDEVSRTIIPCRFILIWKHVVPDHYDSLFFFQKYESWLSKIQKNKTIVSVVSLDGTTEVKRNKALRPRKQTSATTIGRFRRIDDEPSKPASRSRQEKEARPG